MWANTETVAVMSLHPDGHIPGLSPECPASGLTGSWEAGSGHLCPLIKPRLEPGGKVGEASLMQTHIVSDCPGCSSYPAFWGLFWGQCISRWWLSSPPGALLGFWSCLQCSSGSTRSSGVGWPGGVCWPRRVGGVQWKALEQ